MSAGIDDLISAVETLNKIRSFLIDGEAELILSEMGDNQFSSAIDALDKASRANSPREEVRAAANYLRSAQIAFTKGFATNNAIKEWATSISDFNYWRNRAIWAALLRASCYRYLGENRLARECLKEAAQIWDHRNSAEGYSLARKMKYLNFFAGVQDIFHDAKNLIVGDKWAITYEEMSTFYKKMGTKFESDHKFMDS